jgi:hypothetical protein
MEQQRTCEVQAFMQQQGVATDGCSKPSSAAAAATAALGQQGLPRSRLSEGDLPRLQRQLLIQQQQQQQQQQAGGNAPPQLSCSRPQSVKQQQEHKQKQQRMQSAYGAASDSGSVIKRLGWFTRQEKHNKTVPSTADAANRASSAGVAGRRGISSAPSSREAVKPKWSNDSSEDAVELWTDGVAPQQQQQQQLLSSELTMQQATAMPTYPRGSSHGGSSSNSVSRDAAQLQRLGSSSSSDDDSSGGSVGQAAAVARVPFAPQPPSSSRPAAAGPRRLQVQSAA